MARQPAVSSAPRRIEVGQAILQAFCRMAAHILHHILARHSETRSIPRLSRIDTHQSIEVGLEEPFSARRMSVSI
jgi:hypothetical protein